MYRLWISLFALPLSLIPLVSAACKSFNPTTDENIAVTLVGMPWMAATVFDISCSNNSPASCSHPKQNWTITIDPRITANDTTDLTTISKSDAQSIYAFAEGHYSVAAFKGHTGIVTTENLPENEQHVLDVRNGEDSTLLWTPVMRTIEGTVDGCDDDALNGQIIQVVAPHVVDGALVGRWTANIHKRESAPFAGAPVSKAGKQVNGSGKLELRACSVLCVLLAFWDVMFV